MKEPYPNKEDIISSEAMSRASVAGILKNKLSSRALFWIRFIFSFLSPWTYFESLGSTRIELTQEIEYDETVDGAKLEEDLFDDYDSIGICTLDGTMNYLFKLLR